MNDAEFRARVMRLWDQAYNTAEIAVMVSRPEPEVARAVRIGLEERRSKEWE